MNPNVTQQNIDGKSVIIITPAETPSHITVICNSINDEWRKIWHFCEELRCPDINLVLISGLKWDAMLTPWHADRIVTRRDNFEGRADEHLAWIGEKILPLCPDGKRIIAGYSLGGLFAIYSTYKCDYFSAVASGSASVWFPRFLDFVLENDLMCRPEAVYLSLGDMETKSKKPQLQLTESIMRQINEHYLSLGLRSTFELNPGDHFTDYDLRLAKAITFCASALAR
jgi:predicted alpha/beta superfamily hydrolase